jgi:hypothetical protein
MTALCGIWIRAQNSYWPPCKQPIMKVNRSMGIIGIRMEKVRKP